MKSQNLNLNNTNIDFIFSKKNKAKIIKILSSYPSGWKISAVLPLLHLAQKQNDGWLSKSSIEHVAEILEVHPMRVHEVASFYTMFHMSFVGKHVVQVCRTASCWLNGANDLVELCKKKFNINLNETTSDGLITLEEVECLGACINAPVVQINDLYYENLNVELFENILDQLTERFLIEKSNISNNKSHKYSKNSTNGKG